MQPHFQKSVLLASEFRKLLVDIDYPLACFLLFGLRPLPQNLHHPIPNVMIGNTKRLEDRKDLVVQGGLLEPDAGMVVGGVLRENVVEVLADATALRFLGDRLIRDRVARMTEVDKLAAVKKLMGLTSPDSEGLNLLSSRSISNVVVRAGPPFALEPNLPDV